MGATPLFALALSRCPVNACRIETIRSIIAGGEAACSAAPASDRRRTHDRLGRADLLARRHRSRRPDATQAKTASARPGDALVLGKPLGVGFYSAALKKERLDAAGYAALRAITTKLNTPGIALRRDDGVACADRRHRLRPSSRHLLFEVCRVAPIPFGRCRDDRFRRARGPCFLRLARSLRERVSSPAHRGAISRATRRRVRFWLRTVRTGLPATCVTVPQDVGAVLLVSTCRVP
jgi:hypothetical protein